MTVFDFASEARGKAREIIDILTAIKAQNERIIALLTVLAQQSGAD